MIDPPMAPDPLVQHWLKRHRSPISFIMHMVGIPPTILGVLFVSIYVSLLSIPIFLLALALFIGGYMLQFAGHLLEETDPGEIIYFKRKLGLPFVEFPPAFAATATAPAFPLETVQSAPAGPIDEPAFLKVSPAAPAGHLVPDVLPEHLSGLGSPS
jgi:hypothetical protein